MAGNSARVCFSKRAAAQELIEMERSDNYPAGGML